MSQTGKDTGQARPVIARGTGTEVECEALVQHITMVEAEKTLVRGADENASMSLGHIQHQSMQALLGKA